MCRGARVKGRAAAFCSGWRRLRENWETPKQKVHHSYRVPSDVLLQVGTNEARLNRGVRLLLRLLAVGPNCEVKARQSPQTPVALSTSVDPCEMFHIRPLNRKHRSASRRHLRRESNSQPVYFTAAFCLYLYLYFKFGSFV